ncbi:hypothetical protein BH10CHL1_BH10CHL1_05120 [soil metagenome]
MVNLTLVHERTLVGAVDSFLGQLVHVRPHLAGAYRQHLEVMAEHWLATGQPNLLEMVPPSWLKKYLQVPHYEHHQSALRDFYVWAVRENLLERSPLE